MRMILIGMMLGVAACGGSDSSDKAVERHSDETVETDVTLPTDSDTLVVDTDDSDDTDSTDATDDTDVFVPVDTAPCMPDPCLNGSTCAPVAFEAACTCLTGFEGPTCASAPHFVPANVETEEGGSFTDFARYSRFQVFPRAADMPTTPVRITSIRMRHSTNAVHTVPRTIADLQVWMGHAVVPTPGFSNTYADNYATAQTLVFRGAVTVPVDDTASLAFDDVVIELDTPFDFDPSMGQLLIDYYDNTASTTDYVRLDCDNGSMPSKLTFSPSPTVIPTEASTQSSCGPALSLGFEQ